MSDDYKDRTGRRAIKNATTEDKNAAEKKEQENIDRIKEALERRADLFAEEYRKEQEEAKKNPDVKDEKAKSEDGFKQVKLREPQKGKWLDRLERYGTLALSFGLIAIGRSSKYPKSASFYIAERELAKAAIDHARGKDKIQPQEKKQEAPLEKQEDFLTQEEKKVVKKVAEKYGLGKDEILKDDKHSQANSRRATNDDRESER